MTVIVDWLKVGDVGAEIFLVTDVDLSSASARSFFCKKPVSGDVVEFTAVTAVQRSVDGADRWGLLHITATADDLDEAGDWLIEPSVAGYSGFTGRGLQVRLEVKPILSA